MKRFSIKALLVSSSVFLIAGLLTARAAVVYDNTSTDSGRSLNFTNGWTIGNEVILGGSLSSANINYFSFEIYSPNATFAGANVQMQVFLFSNNGASTNGYLSPGTSLYSSAVFTLLTPQQYSPGNNAVTFGFDLSASPVNVSSNFTFAALVTGLASTDLVGFELYTGPTYGQSYGDYWAKDGSSWSLKTDPSGATTIGALFDTTPVPEPSTLAMLGVGAVLCAGSYWRRRQQRQN